MADTNEPYRGDFLAERQAGSPTAFRTLMFDQRVLRPGWGVVLFAVVLLGTITALSVSVMLAGYTPPGPHLILTPHDLLTPLLVFLAVGLATWFPSLLEQRHAVDYGFRGSPWKAAALGLVVSSALITVTLLALHHAGFMQAGYDHPPAKLALQRGAEWAFFFALSALVEELLTRGYLQYTLTRGLAYLYRRMLGLHTGVAAGFWTAALITSSFFAYLYSRNPAVSPMGLMGIFLIGMAYCYSLWRTGSLWWALGFHTAWDFVQGYLFGLWSGGLPIRDHLWLWLPVPNAMTGGNTGLNGSYWVAPILLVAIASLFLLPKRTVYPELWELAKKAREDESFTLPDPDRRKTA